MAPESTPSSVVASDDKEDRLDKLPEKYRDEILRQYDLPEVKVNLFTILGYGTRFDLVLQIVGSIASVGAGISPDSGLKHVFNVMRRRAPVDDHLDWKPHQRLWRSGRPRCKWNCICVLCG
jgi:hypothetical protein